MVSISEIYSSGDIAALVYLWNPLTIFTCVGSSTSPIENFLVVLSIYGACTGMKLNILLLYNLHLNYGYSFRYLY